MGSTRVGRNERSYIGTDKRDGICKIVGCRNKSYQNGSCKDHYGKIKYDKDSEPLFYYAEKGWKVKVFGHPLSKSSRAIHLDKWLRYIELPTEHVRDIWRWFNAMAK